MRKRCVKRLFVCRKPKLPRSICAHRDMCYPSCDSVILRGLSTKIYTEDAVEGDKQSNGMTENTVMDRA